MQVIRDPASTAQIANPEIRRLVEQRIYDRGKEPFDLATLGYLIIVEPGDTLDAISTQILPEFAATSATAQQRNGGGHGEPGRCSVAASCGPGRAGTKS